MKIMPVAKGRKVIDSETVSGESCDDRSKLAMVMEYLDDGDDPAVH